MVELAFVNISHPGEARSRRVQGTVRRHVMKDIGQARRRRPRVAVVPLELRIPSPGSSEEKTNEILSENNMETQVYLGPQWSLNPSGILGMQLSPRILQIVDFMKAEAPKYASLCSVWIRMGFFDTTAFFLCLATGLMFWDVKNGNSYIDFDDNTESGKYYFQALNQLNRRLSDSEQSVSAGVIAAILGCLCHDTRIGNWKRWSLHVDGLDRISRLRGGFDGLENHIPLMAFWLDLVGRTVIDDSPRFSIPRDLSLPPIQDAPLALHLRLFELKSTHPELLPTVQALYMMSSIAHTVNLNGNSALFWKDEVTALQLLAPVTHHLLSAARVQVTHADVSGRFVAAESVRLACLILLSGLKKRFSLNTFDMVPLQAKFASVMARDVNGQVGPLADLSLWALVTSALLLSSDTRVHLVFHIRTMMRRQGILSSQAAIDSAKELIWIDTMEATEEYQLAQEIDEMTPTALLEL